MLTETLQVEPEDGYCQPLAIGIGAPRRVTLPGMQGPVTSEKLAKKLGLSRATVSIVLRGDAERRKISDKTVQRVLKAARDYNYIPNQAARSLRRQRSDVIGVVLPDFRLDWAENVMDGMLEVLAQTSYAPFVAIHRFSPELFRKEMLAAVQRRDDALICYPIPGMSDLYASVQSMGIPLLFIGDRPVESADANWVIWDAGAAAATAVRHLVARGCRRIGFLGFDFPMRMSQARFKAYKTVLKEAGLEMNPQWVSMPSSELPLGEIVKRGVDKILDGAGQRPDGLFVMNDGTALPVMQELQRRGMRLPEDLAVVSMGDVPLAGHAAIGLSTMREPLKELGKGAAEEALRLIADPSERIERIIACEQLLARRTTLGDEWKWAPSKSGDCIES